MFNRHKIDIFVIRLDKTDDTKTKYSKPCKHCITIMKKLGVKRVYYTTGDINKEEWKVEKLSTIKSDHITISNRNIKIGKS